MGDGPAAVLQVAALVALLALAYRPLGAHLARTYTSPRHLRVERLVYRLVGVDGDAEQRWPAYARGSSRSRSSGVALLVLLQTVQGSLPLAAGLPGVPPDLAVNTAVSFVTNTNWQSYAGESTMSHLTQMLGLTVQNFVSAAVGMSVAVALVRGFARSGTDRIGNVWVDLTRTVVRVLLPFSFVAAVLLVGLGVVQNLSTGVDVTTLSGATQTVPGGPVASQEAIKELGTNGGGFYNANSAHPFENPTPADEPDRDLPAARHSCLPDTNARHHGGQRPPGLRRARRDDRALGRRPGRYDDPGAARPRHGTVTGGRCDGGQGDPLRRGRLRTLRHLHDRHLDRCGQLGALVVLRALRRSPAVQHGPRRGRPGRRGLRSLRDARAGDADGVRGRADGRTHAGVPPQAHRRPRDEAGLADHPRHAGHGPDAHGRGDGLRGAARLDAQLRTARPQRGALRLHVRRQQQRLRLRGSQRGHAVLQLRPGDSHAAGPLRADRARAGARRLAGRPAAGRRDRRNAAHDGPALRRDARRRRRDRRRSDLFPVLSLGPLAEGLR